MSAGCCSREVLWKRLEDVQTFFFMCIEALLSFADDQMVRASRRRLWKEPSAHTGKKTNAAMVQPSNKPRTQQHSTGGAGQRSCSASLAGDIRPGRGIGRAYSGAAAPNLPTAWEVVPAALQRMFSVRPPDAVRLP